MSGQQLQFDTRKPQILIKGQLSIKVDQSIQRLKVFEPPEGYYLAFSGGKDSVVIKALADMAGVKYDAHYNLTTVDPPELVQFIRRAHPDVIEEHPEKSMWKLIVEHHTPPTRRMRYCCEDLKERHGAGRLLIFGVRAAESQGRKKNHGIVTGFSRNAGKKMRYMNDNPETVEIVSACYTKQKHSLNPIVDWLDTDVWDFIRTEKTPYCWLYDDGFKRLGCIGCPNAGAKKMKSEFIRWPKYEQMYLRAFERMAKVRKEKGLEDKCGNWTSGEAVMHWWLNDKNLDKPIPGQVEMDL